MRELRILPTITNRSEAALERYLRDIGSRPLLTAEQEVELAQRIQQGDGSALDELVGSNLRFVVSVAKQYAGQNLTLSDLINEGNVGLVTAARRFDPSRGFRFLSYAVWWVRQAILLAILSQGRLVRLPQNAEETRRRIARFAQTFQQEQERLPDEAEIAEALDMDVALVRLVTEGGGSALSVDAPLGEGEGYSLLDMLDAPVENPEEALTQADFREELSRAIDALPQRERDIVRMYFGLDGPELSLEEIGERIGLKRERTRQLKEKAISHLRAALFDASPSH